MLIVLAVIRDRDGRFLLQRRNQPATPAVHRKWELTGGGVAFGESPEMALRRECLEEIGCDIEVLRLVPFIWSNIWKHDKFLTKLQIIALTYECRLIRGTPHPANDEVLEVGWFATKDIPSVEVLPGINEIVRAVSNTT